MIVLLTSALLGCTPGVTQEVPSSPTPSGAGRSEPSSAITPELTARESTLVWPDSLQLTSEDALVYDSWIGGFAGTDSTVITLYGDGRANVKVSGPGHPEKDISATLSSEKTEQTFLRVKESGILNSNEPHGGTVGATLEIRLNGQSDKVYVGGRTPQMNTIVADIEAALISAEGQ